MRSLVPLLAGMLIAATRPGTAQQEGPATNIRVYQLLAARVADSLNAEIPRGDSLRLLLTVKPEGTAWLIQGDIAQSLQKSGRTVVVAMPAAFQVDVAIMEMHVEYENVRTDGFFGGKIVDRTVQLRVNARIADPRSGVIIVARGLHNEFHDTVGVSEIPALEDPNVPATQGALPGEGFFSSLVEPLVMLGAVAVAVYLLFTVRS